MKRKVRKQTEKKKKKESKQAHFKKKKAAINISQVSNKISPENGNVRI